MKLIFIQLDLHQQSWGNFLLSDVNLDRVGIEISHTRSVLLAWLPDIVEPRQDMMIDFKLTLSTDPTLCWPLPSSLCRI